MKQAKVTSAIERRSENSFSSLVLESGSRLMMKKTNNEAGH